MSPTFRSQTYISASAGQTSKHGIQVTSSAVNEVQSGAPTANYFA